MTADDFEAPPFAGFPKATLPFLRELSVQQNRDWFQANKTTYQDEVLAPMLALVHHLTAELTHRRIELRSRGRNTVFRIHRDVRFSNDKRPYKTHIGAAMTRTGEKLSPGVFYLHVDPLGSFAACGFYRPDPPALHALRQTIAAEPAKFKRMLAKLREHQLLPEPDEDSLQRLPRGFDNVDDAVINEALRRRTLILRQPIPDAALGTAGLVAELADFAQAALPLLRYGWSAIDLARIE